MCCGHGFLVCLVKPIAGSIEHHIPNHQSRRRKENVLSLHGTLLLQGTSYYSGANLRSIVAPFKRTSSVELGSQILISSEGLEGDV